MISSLKINKLQMNILISSPPMANSVTPERRPASGLRSWLPLTTSWQRLEPRSRWPRRRAGNLLWIPKVITPPSRRKQRNASKAMQKPRGLSQIQRFCQPSQPTIMTQYFILVVMDHYGTFAKIPTPSGLIKAMDGSPMLAGKSVTGFSNSEGAAVQLAEVVPFLLEDELKAKGSNLFQRRRLESLCRHRWQLDHRSEPCILRACGEGFAPQPQPLTAESLPTPRSRKDLYVEG